MSQCPDLEVLFQEVAEGKGPALDHAQSCPDCSAVLEEHRQLEKDLFRIQDPLPPSNFVSLVMAKVAKAPAPSNSELWSGLSILGTAIALAFALVVARGATVGQVGVAFAHGVLDLRSIAIGLVTGAGGVWKAAAFPLTATVAFMLLLSVAAMRKLAGAEATAKVSP